MSAMRALEAATDSDGTHERIATSLPQQGQRTFFSLLSFFRVTRCPWLCL